MKQAQQMGFKVTLLGGDGWDSPTLYELAGADAAKGNYFSTHFAPDDKDPRVQKFVKDYTARFHKAPGAMSASSYDGILVVADAFKRAGSNDPAALKKALSATKDFVGVAGTLSINAQRDAVKPAVILKTEGNKAVFEAKIEPGQANKSH